MVKAYIQVWQYWTLPWLCSFRRSLQQITSPPEQPQSNSSALSRMSVNCPGAVAVWDVVKDLKVHAERCQPWFLGNMNFFAAQTASPGSAFQTIALFYMLKYLWSGLRGTSTTLKAIDHDTCHTEFSNSAQSSLLHNFIEHIMVHACHLRLYFVHFWHETSRTNSTLKSQVRASAV